MEVTPQQACEQLGETPEVRPAGAIATARVIDVREPAEWEIARLANSELLPMQDVPPQLQRLERLADHSDLLVLCHHGVRSLQVVNWLRQQGIENCYSITGGIDRWSVEIDPSIPRY